VNLEDLLGSSSSSSQAPIALRVAPIGHHVASTSLSSPSSPVQIKSVADVQHKTPERLSYSLQLTPQDVDKAINILDTIIKEKVPPYEVTFEFTGTDKNSVAFFQNDGISQKVTLRKFDLNYRQLIQTLLWLKKIHINVILDDSDTVKASDAGFRGEGSCTLGTQQTFQAISGKAADLQRLFGGKIP
jgi:hypothetical protein